MQIRQVTYTRPTNNGQNWSKIETLAGANICHITYGNGVFVAASGNSNKVYYSTDDGNSWTSTTAGPSNGRNMQGVTYGSNGFVVGKADSSYADLFYSTDLGATWKATSLANQADGGTGLSLIGIAYGNSTYVAVGSAGVVYTSTDAAHWTLMNRVAVASTGYLNSVCYGNGVFVSVDDKGNIYQSSDNGATWSSVASSNHLP